MKTHQLGRALVQLGQALLDGPDVGTEQLQLFGPVQPRLRSSKDDMSIGLTALVALSHVDKRQWSDFIEQLGFPIQVRGTESTRDVIGRLLRYLERDPEARARLSRTTFSTGKVSPELMRALDALLHD